VLDEVVEAYPQDVVVYFKHFPLSTHPESEPAARAAVAAQRQGKFYEMHTILLENQDDQTIKDLLLYAERIGLDMTRFHADFASKETAAIVERDKLQGIELGVEATPALYMNGREYSDPLGFAFLKDWIDEHLAVNR
jgi:protein-disulfide isomerase